MPSLTITKPQLRAPEMPSEWAPWLRKRDVAWEPFLEAVASLGILSILDERDDIECAERGYGAVEGYASWMQAWQHSGIKGLEKNIALSRSLVASWPLATRDDRRNVNIQVRWNPAAFTLAAEWMISQRKGAKNSFRSWFHGEWTDLLIAYQDENRRDNNELRHETQQLITRLLDVQPGHSLLIISGTQISLVWEVLNALKPVELAGKEHLTPNQKNISVAADYGLPVLAAKASLLVQGFPSRNVQPTQLSEKMSVTFDWVIATPPIGAKVGSLQSTAEKSPPFAIRTTRSEQVTFQHAMNRLKPGGRALVLMPRSFCFGRGSERQIRKRVLETARLDAVVNLPAHAAFQNTRVATSLIIICSDMAQVVIPAIKETIGKNAPTDSLAGSVGNHGQPRENRSVLILDERVYDDRFFEAAIISRKEPHQEAVLAVLRLRMGISLGERSVRPLLDIAKSLGENSTRIEFQKPGIQESTESLLSLANYLCDEKTTSGAGFAKIPHLSNSGLVPVESFLERDSEWVWRDLEGGSSRYISILEALVAENPGLQIVKLGEVTDIIVGKNVASSQLIKSETLSAEDRQKYVGVIRPADFPRKKGEPYRPNPEHTPSMFLSPDFSQVLKPGLLLQDNDLLLCRVGKVGKVCLFSRKEEWDILNDASKCSFVASPAIAVIRPKQNQNALRAECWRSLLNSDAGQEWLKSCSFGTSIPQLRIADLSELPVLSAGKGFQLLLLSEHLSAGHSLETASLALHAGPSGDASLNFFLKGHDWRQIHQTEELPSVASKIESLETFQKSLIQWFTQTGGKPPQGQLHIWWARVAEILKTLLKAAQITDPRDSLSALLLWQHEHTTTITELARQIKAVRLVDSTSSTPGTDDVLEKIMHKSAEILLAKRLSAYPADFVQAILSHVEMSASLLPPTIDVAAPSVVTAVLRNSGQISLQDVETRIGGATGRVDLLVAGATLEIPFEFKADHLGRHSLPLDWSAIRLDGKTIKGRILLDLEATENNQSKASNSITNPYVDARTLQGEEDRVFFGRKSEIDRILAELRKPSASTVLLIEGNRRTGKTSLLHHFQRHYLPENWVAAYCTFQSGEGAVSENGPVGRGVPTREIFFILAKAVVEAVVSAGVNLDLDGIGVLESAWRPVLLSRRASSLLRPYFASGPAYEHFRSVLEQCLEALGTRRLLLVIDEFDRLQEGITSGVTSDQVPENIRHLFQTYNQMAGILTGSRKIRRMREEYWNVLFGIGDPVILRGLEEKAVHDLITKPVHGHLTYAPEAVFAIAHLSAGQPRIIQTLCSRLFDLCTQGDNSRLITEAMVEQVAEEKARDYEHFKVVWSAIQSPVDQFVALTINGMERAGVGRVTFSLLQDELAAQGLSISQKKLDAALDNLRDLEVIGERISESTKHYFIEIPLLSRWLLQNQDHDRLREDAQNELF